MDGVRQNGYALDDEEATLGARLAWTPNDQLRLRVAVFDGDPAGSGIGNNPVARDPYGVAFRMNDAPFIFWLASSIVRMPSRKCFWSFGS